MKKKLIVSLLVTFIFVSVFSITVAAQDTTLRFWFGRENFIPGDHFETFEEENPGVTVETDVIPLENAVAEFIRAAQAGNAPDVLQVPADSMGPLARQNLLLDMSEYIEKWENENPSNYDNLVDLAWNMASWQGTPHGVTLHMGPFWYAYRQDWFEEAGIEHPPATWDDVIEAGKMLSNEDRIGFSIIGSRAHDPVWFLSLFMAMGGPYEGNVPQLNSDAGIYLLEFYQQLMSENIASRETVAWDSGDMRASFIGGNAAQALIGDNIFPTLQESLSYGEEWNASAPPVRPGGEEEAKYMALGWPYLVSADTEHPELVSKALQYMSRTEIVKDVALRYQPTTNIAVLTDEEYVEAKPWAPDFQEPFSKLVPLPGHARQPQIYNVLLDAMQEALQNPESDASEIAAEYQAEIDKIVAE